MDIYIKAFLINLLLIFFVAIVDISFLDRMLVKGEASVVIIRMWSLATMISIPCVIVYIVYKAITAAE